MEVRGRRGKGGAWGKHGGRKGKGWCEEGRNGGREKKEGRKRREEIVGNGGEKDEGGERGVTFLLTVGGDIHFNESYRLVYAT